MIWKSILPLSFNRLFFHLNSPYSLTFYSKAADRNHIILTQNLWNEEYGILKERI